MIQFKSNACYFSPICPLLFFLLFLIFCLLLEYGNIFLLFHFSSLFHFQLYIFTRFFFLVVALEIQQVKNPPAMQETQEMRVQSLGWEDPLEEENYNPLQCSCLKNPTYRGAWRAIVQRVAKSRTRLSDSAHTHRLDNIICSLDVLFSSVQFSLSVVSDSLRPHESQHARPPCPSPTPGVYSNSCPSSR